MIEHIETISLEAFKNLTLEERYDLYLSFIEILNAFIDGINNSEYED